MEGLVAEGLVRSLGIQDASVEALSEVLGYAAIPPAVHSLEVTPEKRNDALLAFCRCQVSRKWPCSYAILPWMACLTTVSPCQGNLACHVLLSTVYCRLGTVKVGMQRRPSEITTG